MEAGIYFHIDARHIPKYEYEYIALTALKTIQGDVNHTPLFYQCSYSGDMLDTGGVTLNFRIGLDADPEQGIYQVFLDSGMEDSVLADLCIQLGEVANFMDAAYRCSPMRPKLNPSAPDDFIYLVVKLTLDDPAPFMRFPRYW